MEKNNETVWQYLDSFTPEERAKAIMVKITYLQGKYADSELDAFDLNDTIAGDFEEWLESPSYNLWEKPTCYCTDNVPETDCEGCEHVATCHNTYEPDKEGVQ